MIDFDLRNTILLSVLRYKFRTRDTISALKVILSNNLSSHL